MRSFVVCKIRDGTGNTNLGALKFPQFGSAPLYSYKTILCSRRASSLCLCVSAPLAELSLCILKGSPSYLFPSTVEFSLFLHTLKSRRRSG